MTAVETPALEEPVDEMTEEARAELSGKAINDLPDSAFAYIEPGGTKDAEGRTVPRSKRHFPVHDEAHARNALARAPQSPFGDKAMPKILAACKKFGIEVQQNSEEEVGPGPARRRKRERHRAVPLFPEVRHWQATGLEVRSAKTTDEIIITGSPIVFNTPYPVRDMFGEFQETMRPGVASDVLSSGADVRFLFNHDGLPLARSTSGTLRLAETTDSVDFEARLDARQQLANDLAIAIERGDVSQMSCGFIVGRDQWDEEEENRDVHLFSDLLDVSAVTYPASPTTSIQIAQRMAMEVPVESRARLRRIYQELRAGKVLSADNQAKLVNAAQAIHAILDSAGFDPSDLTDPDQDGPSGGGDGRELAVEGTEGDIAEGQGFLDGTGERARVVDPGEPIRSKRALALRMKYEALQRRT